MGCRCSSSSSSSTYLVLVRARCRTVFASQSQNPMFFALSFVAVLRRPQGVFETSTRLLSPLFRLRCLRPRPAAAFFSLFFPPLTRPAAEQRQNVLSKRQNTGRTPVDHRLINCRTLAESRQNWVMPAEPGRQRQASGGIVAEWRQILGRKNGRIAAYKRRKRVKLSVEKGALASVRARTTGRLTNQGASDFARRASYNDGGHCGGTPRPAVHGPVYARGTPQPPAAANRLTVHHLLPPLFTANIDPRRAHGTRRRTRRRRPRCAGLLGGLGRALQADE